MTSVSGAADLQRSCDAKLANVSGMEVLCACDERYLPHAATMLRSLLAANRVERVHFIHDGIARNELARLARFVKRRGSALASYEIRPEDLGDVLVDKWASIAVYYRLLAARLLPTTVSKVLYLDCDLIVRRSLSGLWDTNVSNAALAAVEDLDDSRPKALGLPAGEKYFNSGVLLMNLDYWRENHVAEEAMEFIRRFPEKLEYWDQDALNGTLVHRWVEAPRIWNEQNDLFAARTGASPAIVHFCGETKPWRAYSADRFKLEYYRHRRATPWRRYKLEGRPAVPQKLKDASRSLARAVLPRALTRWLRTQIASLRSAA
jgi:lipopolysaccharide biosynthesis glycosyltransferase